MKYWISRILYNCKGFVGNWEVYKDEQFLISVNWQALFLFYLMGKAASPIRAFRQLHHKTPLGKITSHLSFAEHYFLTKTAEVSMFPLQVGVIQMAADKTMLKKK